MQETCNISREKLQDSDLEISHSKYSEFEYDVFTCFSEGNQALAQNLKQ